MQYASASEAETQDRESKEKRKKQMNRRGAGLQASFLWRDTLGVQVLQGLTGYTGLRVPKSVPMKMKKSG